MFVRDLVDRSPVQMQWHTSTTASLMEGSEFRFKICKQQNQSPQNNSVLEPRFLKQIVWWISVFVN